MLEPTRLLPQHLTPLTAALLLAAVLGGCASVPALPPVTPPSASAQVLQHRRLSNPALQRFITLQTGSPQPADQPWDAHRPHRGLP